MSFITDTTARRGTIALGVAAACLIAGTAHAGWGQLCQFFASDGGSRDSFGAAALSGNTAIIGACWDHDPCGYASGSAYLFDLSDPANPVELHKLTAEEFCTELDHFGISVAIDGDVAMVGAHAENDGCGATYLFDVQTGTRLHRLTATDGSPGGNLGCSVAVRGNRAIAGAWLESSLGHQAGAAYLFNVTTGQQLAKLTASDGAAGSHFGFSVCLDDNIALIGAYGAANHTGAAYIFDLNTHQQLAKLTAYDGAPGDAFGVSVSIDGDVAIVGADGVLSNDPGAAYLFDVSDPANPVPIMPKLTAADGSPGDGLGSRVSISGQIAAVGARYDYASTGSAYLFSVTTGAQLAKLTADNGQVGDEFGFVALDGDLLVIGAPYNDQLGWLAGTAYVFGLEECSADVNGDGAVDSLDLTLVLAAWGATSGPEDVNADGIVNVLDVLLVLSSWGPC